MKPSELNRRAFLHMAGGAATTATLFGAGALERVEAAGQSMADKTPQEVARDEFYWREIQLAFKLDRTLINMNNGFTSPMPRVSLESVARYMDMINMLPGALPGHGGVERPDHPPPDGERVRLRPRGDGAHARRQRVAADRPERHRPEGRATRSSPPSRTTRAC